MSYTHFTRLMSENNQFFFAQVVTSDPATYVVQIAPTSGRMPGLMVGIPLASSLAGLLGAKECFLPQPGSLVFCFKADATTALILGVVPEVDASSIIQQYHARTNIGAGDGNSTDISTVGYDDSSTAKLVTTNSGRPTDVVHGEHVVATDFGVLLGLFHHFATLKASDLAQVQAFLFDDLVRIVSHNFQHYTCMGETKVFQDGEKLSQEFGLTHSAKEAQGTPEVDGSTASEPPLVKLTGEVDRFDDKNFFTLEKENAVGIERLKGFVGALGNFVHLLFTLPHPKQQREQNGEKTDAFDRGLASVRVGMDGNIALRTATGFSFEKSNWIRVPQRIKRVEKKDAPAKLPEATTFTFDNQAAISDGVPFLYFLQMRDYMAHLQEAEGYRAFPSDEFELNTDYTKERPLPEVSSTTPNTPITLNASTCGVYTMPNGGLAFRDAWGSAIIMEGGNIYLQPAKDLITQPLRNSITKVGGFVSVAAKKDIDLSTTDGGFRLKTDGPQYLYSDSSGIIIHANADAPADYAASENGPVLSVGGIVLNAPKSSVTVSGQHALLQSTNNMVLSANNLLIDADQRVLLRSTEGFDIFTSGEMLIAASRSLVGFSEETAIFAGLNQTAIGMQKQVVAAGTMGPVEGLFKPDAFDQYREQTDRIKAQSFDDWSVIYRDDAKLPDMQFRFLPSATYGVSDREGMLPQTIAQQEDKHFENHGLTPWEETEVNGSLPYPGADYRNSYAVSSLQNLDYDPNLLAPYNKATEHTIIGKIDFQDVFKDYPVYV